jgi:hypothetical protein
MQLPCSLVDKYPCFSWKCFHLQDRRGSMFLKEWYLLTKLHNAASQMTLIFIYTVVRTSNLTIIIFIQYLRFCVIFLSSTALLCNRPVTNIINNKSLPSWKLQSSEMWCCVIWYICTMFWRNVVLLPLEYKSSLEVLFYAEDGGSKFLQNFSINHTTATVWLFKIK